ncbi:MAG: NAD(P)-dependent oxidoreductase [Verrucomicrobiota bacterium]
MKILVTGGQGFLGKPFAERMARCGHTVLAPVSTPGGLSESLDLFDSEATQTYLSKHKPQGLVHFAWETTPGAYWSCSSNLSWVSASIQLLSSFAEYGGKRVLVVGSSAEYSWNTAEVLSESRTPLSPSSLYGISKLSLFQILNRWSEDIGLSFAWPRIFCPFGPRERPERLIPRIVTQLSTGKEVLFDSGNSVRDFLHVEEVASAIQSVFESTYQGAINIGSGEGLAIREVVSGVADFLDAFELVKFDRVPDPVNQPSEIVALTEILNSEIGWKPNMSFNERLGETCEWYLKQLGV